MTRLTLAALAVLLAAPAAAQDIRFNITPTLACLGRAQTDAPGDPSCIGTAAEICMEVSDGGFSTVGMVACISRELDYWDARLNDSYQALRARHRADDADTANIPGIPSMELALRDMQRAWIPFRDATCDYERSLWGGGTGGGPATAGCRMRLTGQQALYLEGQLAP